MNIFVCFNPEQEKAISLLPQIVDVLCDCDIQVTVSNENKQYFTDERVLYGDENILAQQCNIILTAGGDGTMLKWGKLAATTNKPMLGINTGTLGFMATLEQDELHKLSRLTTGDYHISKRMLLDITLGKTTYLAINDVVLYKQACCRLPEFSVYSDDSEVSRLRADGLIFSTPTGSTAYALSAGGPIVEPELSLIELTPLSPHTLFSRTMLFSGEKTLSVTYRPSQDSEVYVSVDGNCGKRLREEETLLIRRSETRLRLIDLERNSFYDAIHNKLMKPMK